MTTVERNRRNPAVGREFQQAVCLALEELYQQPFDLELSFSLGMPPKPHRFDCVSRDKRVAAECKCYTWTDTGNIPQAKLATLNEAVLYMTFLPDTVEKVIVLKREVHPKTGESLAEYYLRRYGHLLRDVQVMELDDRGALRRLLRAEYVAQKEHTFAVGQTDLSELWNEGGQKDWERALDHYDELLTPVSRELEWYLSCVDKNWLAHCPVEEFYDFLYEKYFVWKYTAKNRLATTRASLSRYRTEGRMQELEGIRRRLFSFDRRDIRAGMDAARDIRGLGTAGAAGLLSILFPEEFGTVDQFVVKSLLKVDGLPEHERLVAMNPEMLRPQDGVLLIAILRDKAAQLNRHFGTTAWTPRKLDQILWSFGR